MDIADNLHHSPRVKRIVYLGNVWEYPLLLAAMSGLQLAALLYEEPGDAQGALEVSRRTGARTYRVKDDAESRLALGAVGSVDLGVIANFGIILSRETLGLPAAGFINCHPGLLPGQKGREPVSRLWKSGGGASGLTIHAAELLVDAGKVLAVAPHAIDPKKTFNQSLHALYLAGLPLLKQVVPSRLDTII